jgi:hypothetical protein
MVMETVWVGQLCERLLIANPLHPFAFKDVGGAADK